MWGMLVDDAEGGSLSSQWKLYGHVPTSVPCHNTCTSYVQGTVLDPPQQKSPDGISLERSCVSQVKAVGYVDGDESSGPEKQTCCISYACRYDLFRLTSVAKVSGGDLVHGRPQDAGRVNL